MKNDDIKILIGDFQTFSYMCGGSSIEKSALLKMNFSIPAGPIPTG